ncbi:unnamed protein product, partial [Orchesella dallaii]
CIDNHGKESQCKAELCHWCPCSKLCVPEKYGFGCDSGCAGLCNDVDECAARGCIFDPGEKKCYDVDVDTNVDLRAICGEWHANSNECTRNGCRYCPCSEKCLAPQDGLNCDIGCYQFCNQIDECASHGCGYQEDKCFQWQDWQIALNTPDEILYDCEFEARDADISIPVREAGYYEIGLHLAEIFLPRKRRQSFKLNGVTIVSNLDVDSYGGAGTTIWLLRNFTVNCDITEITVGGQTRSIVDKLLVLNIVVHYPTSPPLDSYAILSAYYLKKLDT